MQKAQALSNHIQATPVFTYMNTLSPTSPFLMAIVDAATNRMSHAINAAYEKNFRTAGEMVGDLFGQKVRPSFPPCPRSSLPPSLPPSFRLSFPAAYPCLFRSRSNDNSCFPPLLVSFLPSSLPPSLTPSLPP